MLSHSVFNPMSPQAQAISNLTIFLMLLGLLISVGIVGVMIYALIRFRARPGQEGEPPQTFGITRLEIAWTATPFVLVTLLFFVTVSAMQHSSPGQIALNDGARTEPRITIIGHQWWWEIRYPSGVVTANEIHIPVGQRWVAAIKSVDVIHSFWEPQLGPKIQAVPGQTNYIWLEADRPGVYHGSCGEFCGAGHAWMLVDVVAEPMAKFKAWEQQQMTSSLGSPPAGFTASEATQGAALFGYYSCGSCHFTDIGPSLTHMASRSILAAGAISNTPAHMEQWLLNPDAIKPGVHMPNFQLSELQARDLTAYLESASAPQSAAHSVASHWLVWNAKSQTATLTLVAGYNSALSGFNFDGYGKGAMVISVPAGAHVTVVFTNKASLPHSAVFTAYSNVQAASGGFAPAFQGASSPNPVSGTTPGQKQQFTFMATKVGKYALVCAVPGHVQAGMWDVLMVTKGGKPSVKAGNASL